MVYQTMVIAAVSWLQPPNLHLTPSHTCLARVRLPWLSCMYNICAELTITSMRGEDEGATFPPFFPLSFFFLFLFFSPFLSPPFRGDLKVFHQHDLKASKSTKEKYFFTISRLQEE